MDNSLFRDSYVLIDDECILYVEEPATEYNHPTIPYAMGGKFPKYTITNLSGTVNDGTLSVSMNCGSSPVTFEGRKNN